MKIEMMPGAKLTPQSLMAWAGNNVEVAGVVMVVIDQEGKMAPMWSNMSHAELAMASVVLNANVQDVIAKGDE